MADDVPTSREPPAAVTSGAPVVVPRWVQLVMLPLAVLALYALAHAAGVVLLLFVVAAVIALILNPLVVLLQRTHAPRGVAVFAVYLAFFTLLPFIGFLAAGPVSDQATSFANDVPGLVDDASLLLDDVQEFFDDKGIDVQIKGESESALASLQDQIVKGSGEIVALTGELLGLFFELSFYVILVVVLSIYMLVYAPRIGTLVRSVMPPGDGTPEDDYPTRVQRAVAGYVRGQLLFSAIMGLSAGSPVDLRHRRDLPRRAHVRLRVRPVLRRSWSSCPYVGPVLGATPPVLVALVQDPGWRSGWPCCSSRCSSSRATSSHRTSSAARCA